MEAEQTRLKKQKILILLCCLAYSFAYVGRYSYTANIVPIEDYYGLIDDDKAGLVSSFFFFAYGASQFLHAIFCRFYPKRIVIPCALILSTVINLILFFRPPFESIKYLWALNGICQALLWPTLILTLSEVLDDVMMKRAVLVMSFSVLIGTFLAYGGSALFNLWDRFYVSFLFGAILMVVVGAVWLFSYPTLTAEKAEKKVLKIEQKQTENARKAISGALIGLLTVCVIFAATDNFIKDGLNTWTPKILTKQFGFGNSVSMVMTLVLPFFGVFGSMLALQTNRRIKDFRALSGFFYLLLSIALGGLLFSVRQNTVALFLICLGLISCLAHGINAVLTSIMPLVMRDQINSGFLAGAMNAACYIGSTASGYGLGKIADNAGWNTVIYVLLISAASMAAIAGVVTVVGIVRKRKSFTIKEAE